MNRVGVIVVAAVAAGCGETVVVDATGAQLVLVQDGSEGTWERREVGADGKVTFDTGGDYGLAYFCPPGEWHGRAFASVELRTTDDPVPVVECVFPPYVRVTGATAPGAFVFADASWATADSGGSFELLVPPGRHDVVVLAVSQTTSRMTIVRDVDAVTTPPLLLPVDSGWHEVGRTPWPDAGNSSLYLGLRTCGGTTAYLRGGAEALDLHGSGALTACDHAVYGAEEGFTGARYVEVPQDGSAPAFVLPDWPDPYVVGRTMYWLGDWDQASFSTSTVGETRLTVTSSRFGRSGRAHTTPSFNVTILPGWQAGMPEPVPGESVSLSVRRGEAGRDLARASQSFDLSP